MDTIAPDWRYWVYWTEHRMPSGDETECEIRTGRSPTSLPLEQAYDEMRRNTGGVCLGLHPRRTWLVPDVYARPSREKPAPSNAPMYCAALYPDLAKIARTHGYALAVHGSLARDMDLICVPWIADCSEPPIVVQEIASTFEWHVLGHPTAQAHGRITYTISSGFNAFFLDLSFMPREKAPKRTRRG